MKSKNILFFTVILLFFQLSFAEDFIEINTSTRDGVLLRGVHLSSPGGSPVLLVHGFMSNTRSWREVAYSLRAKGHDVYMFNMRGHGNGKMNSSPLGGSRTLMNFDNIVTYDIPAMLEYAYSRSGQQPVTYVGHSMGTMSARLTFSGVTKDENDNVYISEQARDWALKRLRGVIAVASPTTLSNSFALGTLFSMTPVQALQLVSMMLRVTVIKGETSFENSAHSFKSFLVSLKQKAIDMASHAPVLSSISRPVLNVDSLKTGEREVARLLRKGISIPPTDLVKDAKRWIQAGYKSSDGAINYEHLEIPDSLKYIFVGAELDELSHPGDIFRDYVQQRNKHNQGFVYMQGHSHVDIVSGEVGGGKTAHLIDFLISSGFSLKELASSYSYEGVQVLSDGITSNELITDGCFKLLKGSR